MIFGDARFAKDGQSVAARLAELRTAGAADVFRETGSHSDGAKLRGVIRRRAKGDVVLTTYRPFGAVDARPAQ